MLAVLLIAVGLMILMGDPSVKDEEGLKKLEKIASGTKTAFTKDEINKQIKSLTKIGLTKDQAKKLIKNQAGAPSPWEDFFGWLFWNGK